MFYAKNSKWSNEKHQTSALTFEIYGENIYDLIIIIIIIRVKIPGTMFYFSKNDGKFSARCKT